MKEENCLPSFFYEERKIRNKINKLRSKAIQRLAKRGLPHEKSRITKFMGKDGPIQVKE